MKELIFCEVGDDGKLIRGAKRITEVLKLFKGKRVTIEIEKTRSKRSGQQNRYLWGVVYECLQMGFKDLGHRESKETIHEFCKQRFLRKEIVHEETGEVLTLTKSTTELTKSEMMDYIAEIQQFAAEYLNVIIPDPNEQVEIF